MFKVPELYRNKNGILGSTEQDGCNGFFEIPLSNRTKAYVMASDGMGWEHVSVHVRSDNKQRCPTWSEMCKIKEMFWDDEDCVVQFHPPKSEYVDNHKYCLHLWREVGKEFNRPDSILVGIKTK